MRTGLKLLRKLHQTIAKITLDFEGRWHFNTCVAAIMELVNEIASCRCAACLRRCSRACAFASCCATLVLLLAPFALTSRPSCGSNWARRRSAAAPWPVSDPELAKEDEIEIPVQINGKLVSLVRVPADADSKEIETAALADEKVRARIAGKTIAK